MASSTHGALTLVALAELGQAMRDAQHAYFRSRRRRDSTYEGQRELLESSRRLEGEFDEALRRILRPKGREPLPGQTSFLDGEGG